MVRSRGLVVLRSMRGFTVHRRRAAATAILTGTFAPSCAATLVVGLSSSRACANIRSTTAFLANPRTSAFPTYVSSSRRNDIAHFVTLPDGGGGGNAGESGERISVTETVYSGPQDAPVVQLYTKHGCTLCDKVSDVLRSVRNSHPHTLEAVDITDDDKKDLYDKYKYDIPVLHLDGKYWVKHRLTSDAAIEALVAAKAGKFEEQAGEPDAGAMERKQAERQG
mmetsp:Transcript_22308/g.49723  ORF Transcript_22308/g.49723 Transcript_22308/m.49723 type:complete len:223 (+) Transcript_22308:81-749(+)